MTAINENQVKTLEQTRQRLLHLTHSLESLTGSLHQSDPLPSWSSLQSQASIISNNLTNICSQLAEHQELLSSLVAYPAPTFPGTTQQNVLEQLLRTKLEPRVEDWVTRGRIKGTEASSINENNGGSSSDSGHGNGLSEAELADLWSWAPIEANSEARRRNWGGNYTLEEKEMGIQNVVTGLLRPLPDDDEEDEDEDEEEEEDEEFENINGDAGERMEIVGVHTRPGTGAVEFDIARERDHVQSITTTTTVPALPLNEVFRFMMTGTKPKSGIA